MKVEITNLVKTEVEIETPFYFKTRLNILAKAYEDYSVFIYEYENKAGKKEAVSIEVSSLKDVFLNNEHNIMLFINEQEELKTEFENKLAEIMAKVSK